MALVLPEQSPTTSEVPVVLGTRDSRAARKGLVRAVARALRSGAAWGVFFTGPMFAGKTSALLALGDELGAEGGAVVLVRWHRDTRYDAAAVVTHDGTRRDGALLVSCLAEVPLPPAGAAVLVDEAQFFPDLCLFARRCAAAGCLLAVAGLSRDFRDRPFGQGEALATQAGLLLVPLCAVCQLCGSDRATHSARTTPDCGQTLLGGSDAYMATCKPCWQAFSDRHQAVVPDRE